MAEGNSLGLKRAGYRLNAMKISRFTLKREAILIAILSFAIPVIGMIAGMFRWAFGYLGE